MHFGNTVTHKLLTQSNQADGVYVNFSLQLFSSFIRLAQKEPVFLTRFLSAAPVSSRSPSIGD